LFSFIVFVVVPVAADPNNNIPTNFCRRQGWRENYGDDIKLAFKALTGSSDWVNITTTTTTTTKRDDGLP
jgi:hypothetical protein